MSSDRLPPQNREAEEAILGSLLIDPDAIFDVHTFLRAEAFYSITHRWIFEAILALYNRGEAIDSLTVIEELRRRDQLEEVGGEAYIVGLVSVVPTSINAASYGRIVEAAAVRRDLLQAASNIAQLAYEEDEDINVVLDRAEQKLFSISEQRTTRDLVPVRQIAEDYLARIEELHAQDQDIVGVPTGFTDLDRLLGGLNKSDLVILAARPGMGKCVTADTRLLDPRSGRLTDIETLFHRHEADLVTLDNDLKLVPGQASHFVDSGVKPVFRVTTALGREIKTTAAHPFLTVGGWKPLHALKEGDRVAVPRALPFFGSYSAPKHEPKLIGYFLGDGCLTDRSPSFSNSNPALRADFIEAALKFPGNKARIEDSQGKRTPSVSIAQDSNYKSQQRPSFAARLKAIMAEQKVTTKWLAQELQVADGTVDQWRSGRNIPAAKHFAPLCQILKIEETQLLPNGHAEASQTRNTVTEWLEEVGLWGKGAAEKFVPDIVFTYSRPRLALFLNRLFACDGSAYLQNQQQPVVSYSTISARLAADVRHLLLRFGIIAKLRRRQIKYQGGVRPAFQLRITHAPSLHRFIDEIGALGKEAALDLIAVRLSEVIQNTNRDTLPVEVWQQVELAKGTQSWSAIGQKMGLKPSHNFHVGRRGMSRQRLNPFAQVLKSPALDQLANSDVYWDTIEAIEPLGNQQVYDLCVPETHNFVADDMIVHNTSLQNGMALTAARTYGKRVAIFNLEMSGEQLVQRMLASETRIDIQRLRRGNLQDHEWPIFYEAVQRLSATRIFIDDTPSITPMQLRTKSRRLYAEHGLDMIMIDYLQLMQADRSTNNRVQEIGDISRGLKQLAREIDVPVVAAAQLSRGVESRQDKRPLLSDLRDSGCLTGDTLVTVADSGLRVPIRELKGKNGFKVWSLNEKTLKLEACEVSNAFSTGVKSVYQLTTKLGRTIRATGNHKFRAFDGWKRLDKLQEGELIALPRTILSNGTQSLSDSAIALIGHLIGDGCVLPRHAIQYTTKEEDLAVIVSNLAKDVFGNHVKPRINKERQWYQVYLPATRHLTHGIRNPISELFETLGIFGLRSYEKFIPEEIFTQPTNSICLFLRHLWATDGCLRVSKINGRLSPTIYYASSSYKLSQGVQTLLLRLGINARLKKVSQKDKGRNQFHVIVSGKPDVVRFINEIGAVGKYKETSLNQIKYLIMSKKGNTNRDVIPNSVWRNLVVPAMKQEKMTAREMQAAIEQTYCGTSLYKQNLSRERANRVALAVKSKELKKLANGDVYWDQISSIEYVGEEEVFDLTVPTHHNFIANNIIVHNSIEQDADIVMFIYRDEYYNPETTDRPNIAELNIAKHRNGPTATIDLYWNGELASFANLQRQEVNL